VCPAEALLTIAALPNDLRLRSLKVVFKLMDCPEGPISVPVAWSLLIDRRAPGMEMQRGTVRKHERALVINGGVSLHDARNLVLDEYVVASVVLAVLLTWPGPRNCTVMSARGANRISLARFVVRSAAKRQKAHILPLMPYHQPGTDISNTPDTQHLGIRANGFGCGVSL